jgi:acid phosphatase
MHPTTTTRDIPVRRLASLKSILALGSALALAGCSSGFSGNVGNGSGGTTASIPQVQHVVVVTLENANYGDVVGTQNMPYLANLISQGALVSKYYANTHPSLPNYFMMTTGEAITNDDSYSDTATADNNIVREMAAAGKTWKVYTESLPSAGYIGGDQGPYLRHHNPFTYFSDVQQSTPQAAKCRSLYAVRLGHHDGRFPFKLPNYAFVVPNLVDDAHSCITGGTTDCTLSSRLKTADGWLQTNIGPLLNTTEFQTSGLLIALFEESADDITNGGGHVLAMMTGTHVRAGYNTSTTSYDHRSLLSLTMKTIGVANIPNGADAAPQMTEFFK